MTAGTKLAYGLVAVAVAASAAIALRPGASPVATLAAGGTIPGELTDPAALPASSALAEPIDFASGRIRLRPPGAAIAAVDAATAFRTGFLAGPYHATRPPDRVVLALFSDDDYGTYVGLPAGPRISSPAERAAAAQRTAGRQATGPAPGVRPHFQSHLVWAYLYFDEPYDHLRAGVLDSDFAVIVDATTGRYLEHFSQPAR